MRSDGGKRFLRRSLEILLRSKLWPGRRVGGQIARRKEEREFLQIFDQVLDDSDCILLTAKALEETWREAGEKLH